MIHENIELQNVGDLTPHGGGVALQRVPESIREQLFSGGRKVLLQPASGEIRFALKPGSCAQVTLSVVTRDDWGPSATAVVFFGDYRHFIVTIGAEPKTIEIGWNANFLAHYDELVKRPHTFAPNVVRFVLSGAQVVFHSATGADIRPPRPDELPSIRYLAYGTSITHIAAATTPSLSYAAQTARHLGADLLNMGMSGCCHVQTVLADYFASRDDWDIASLALSVNMMAFAEATFAERVQYMVHTVAGAHPQKPVACITLFPYFAALPTPDGEKAAKVERFRQMLRDAVASCPTANAHLIEGSDILRSFTGLTTDLIHPSDDGMIEMGHNLAAALRPLLP